MAARPAARRRRARGCRSTPDGTSATACAAGSATSCAVTWLGGMRILERLDRVDYDVFARRPTPRASTRPRARRSCGARSIMGRWPRAGERAGMFPQQNHERPRHELLLFISCAARRQAQRHRRGVGLLPRRRRCRGRAGGSRSRVGARAMAQRGRAPLRRARAGRRRRERASRRSSRRLRFRGRRFEDLIDGVAMDLQRNRYDTFEELRQYCLRVASAVGPDLRRDLRISRSADPRLRDRSGHRAAADEHHPRRGARSRARPRVHPGRGSAALRLHRRRLAGGRA